MPPPRTRLLLIRHGETTWNAAGRWQGHADPPLTERGREQADALARELSAKADARWSRVLSSDLSRARQTAEAVAAALGLPLTDDERLRELDVGAWSGLTRAQIAERDPETLQDFEQGEPSVRPGGGESRLEIRERTRALAGDLVRRFAGESLLVVTHLGVIRALVPGAEPRNTERIEVVAEDVVARPLDRHRRPSDGPL